MEGVIEAKVALLAESAEVHFDPMKVTVSAITNAVEDLGEHSSGCVHARVSIVRFFTQVSLV